VNNRLPSAIGSGPASNGYRNGSSSSYVPVFNKTSGDISGNIGVKQQAAKRRKVFVPGKQEISLTSSYPPKSPTNGDTSAGSSVRNDRSGTQRARNDAPRSRATNRNTVSNPVKAPIKQVPQHLFRNKAPSTSFINNALKSERTKKLVVEDMLSSEPAAFHIGSMPMDEEQERDVYDLPKSPVASLKTARPKAPERRKSSSTGSDIQMYDTNYTLTAFPFRKSPKKKSTNPTLQNSKMRSSPQPAPVSFTRAANINMHEERDSVISSSTGQGAMQDTPPAVAPSRIAPNAGPIQLPAGRFSEEEDHLLIFLKEVKRAKWTDIMEHFPGRKFGGVQTHYSHKLNRRNRALDPPRLNLPPKYATESSIDWTTVHENSPRPARKPETRDLIQEAERFARPIQQPARIQQQDSFSRDDSSANESGQVKARPRRNAPQVNYKWPRRNRAKLLDEDSVMEGFIVPDERGISTPLDSDEALEEAPLGPDVFIPVDKPMDMNFEQEDASLAVSLVQAGRGVISWQKIPYLSFSQRSVIRNCPKDGEWEQLSGRDWQGSVVHVDFNDEEEAIVERAALKILNTAQVQVRSNGRKRFHKLLKDQPEKKILQLAYEIRRKLFARDQESIDAFLADAKNGKLSSNPHVERIGAVRPARKLSSIPKTSTSSLVRQRELGLQSRRGWKSSSKPLSYQMMNNVQDTLGPAYSFTGASSDVHTVAWSPDGQSFAAGAVCVTDPDSMQYNRPNNLLYGDLSNGTIRELGEHVIARTKTETGANSTHAMHSSQDPVLYTTISSVAFSPQGEYMFSAGYDSHACIWRTSRDGSQPELIKSLRHRAEVDIMTVGPHGKIATAAKRWTSNAVKVITIRDDTVDFTFEKQSYTSSKALRQPDMNILPTALAFEPNDGRFLLAGFGANSKASENRLDTNGDICLWDVGTQEQLAVHGSGKNVFDVAFNPMQRYQPLFAVGCVAGANVNRGTRSMVRLYDTRGYDAKFSMMAELECAALDMNDVTWW
jgi:WD40 repeat protein